MLGGTDHTSVSPRSVEIARSAHGRLLAQADEIALAHAISLCVRLVAAQVAPLRILEGNQVRHRIDQSTQQRLLTPERLLRFTHAGHEHGAVDHGVGCELVEMPSHIEEVAHIDVQGEIQLGEREHPGSGGEPSSRGIPIAQRSLPKHQGGQHIERCKNVLGADLERGGPFTGDEADREPVLMPQHDPHRQQRNAERGSRHPVRTCRWPAPFGQQCKHKQANHQQQARCKPELYGLVGPAWGNEHRHACV